MNTQPLIPPNEILKSIEELHIKSFQDATIREVVCLSKHLEKKMGIPFIHMEMGIPGLEASPIGVAAEIEALQHGVAAAYPNIEGLPQLKKATAHFLKAFADIDIEERTCIPVVGSMQGSYASFMASIQRSEKSKKILFIDPGFPVQKQQLKVMGYAYETFDIYHYRGEKLEEKLHYLVSNGDIAAIIYSNPNNPSWICFTEDELQSIARVADAHDLIIIEDLAYFGMDFRQDISTPYQAPFQISIAQYTDNYILLLSGSKAFSYAGQRIGMACLSPQLYDRSYPAFTKRYGVSTLGLVFVQRILYSLSSGTSHSAQYALAAMLEQAAADTYHFREALYTYRDRAKVMKQLFLQNGFHLVYDKDGVKDLADGFYFTVGYPQMSSHELMFHLICFGISSISLSNTGSNQAGIRACVSFVNESQWITLAERLRLFHEYFSPNH